MILDIKTYFFLRYFTNNEIQRSSHLKIKTHKDTHPSQPKPTHPSIDQATASTGRPKQLFPQPPLPAFLGRLQGIPGPAERQASSPGAPSSWTCQLYQMPEPLQLISLHVEENLLFSVSQITQLLTLFLREIPAALQGSLVSVISSIKSQFVTMGESSDNTSTGKQRAVSCSTGPSTLQLTSTEYAKLQKLHQFVNFELYSFHTCGGNPEILTFPLKAAPHS